MIDPEQWATPLEAIRLLEPKYGDRTRSVIVTRCERGLLDAMAAIEVRTFQNRTQQVWNGEWERFFEEAIPDTRQIESILSSEFWSIGHATAPPEGHDDISGFNRTVYADWEVGDFGYKQDYGVNPALEWERCEAAGVHFNRQQLSLLTGTFGRNEIPVAATNSQNRTKYDWELAIASFAGAQQKFDIIPDLYAHGAQAAIEKWIAEWFASRGLYPAEPTIRPKAALILSAYKKADACAADPN